MHPGLQHYFPNNRGASPGSDKRALSSRDAAERSKSSNATNQKPSAEVEDNDREELHGLTPAPKFNKATVGSPCRLSQGRPPNAISRFPARLPNTSEIWKCDAPFLHASHGLPCLGQPLPSRNLL